MIILRIRKQKIGPVLARHPWVFAGAILNIPEGLAIGEIVELQDERGNFLARGYFNSYAQLAVRIFTWEKEEINEDFFYSRIHEAKNIRLSYIDQKATNAFRIINSEADFLPGLTVDKYAEYLVIQLHNRGISAFRELIINALQKVWQPLGIFENSEIKFKDENDAKTRKVLAGSIPDKITIKENNLNFSVDVKQGQKTGFFLDQREKRAAIQKYAPGKKVLNCFSYTGGFSIYAKKAGAEEVISVDSAQSALDLAKENFNLNNLEINEHDFICEDVMKYLFDIKKDQFDVIVLDPPAFIKDRRKIIEGKLGYRKINEQAMRLLPSGGILVTCSCSHHLTMADFRFLLAQAASWAKRRVRILETFTSSLDHPQTPVYLEGDYLKCFILQIN